MPRSDVLRENAKRLLQITAADPNRAAAIERLRAIVSENPFLETLAPEYLDTPDFIFAQLDAREQSVLLQNLSPSALAFLESMPTLQAHVARIPGRKRTGGDKAAGKREFYATVAMKVSEGSLSADPGLFLSLSPPCPKRSIAAGEWRVFSMNNWADTRFSLDLWILGPPGKTVSLEMYWGSLRLTAEKIKLDAKGITQHRIETKQLFRLLPEHERTRSRLLYAVLRASQGQPAVLHCIPIILDSSADLVTGDRGLFLEARRSGQNLLARVTEYDVLYNGSILLSVICHCCGQTLASTSAECKGEQEQTIRGEFPGHSGPFTLRAQSTGSGRAVSVWISDAHQSAKPSIPLRIDDVAVEDPFSFTAALPGDGLFVYSVFAEDSGRHRIFDDLLTTLDPTIVPDSLARRVIENSPGMSAQLPLFIRRAHKGEIRFHLPGVRKPGRYRINAVLFSGGQAAFAETDFNAAQRQLLILPAYLDEDSRISARFHSPQARVVGPPEARCIELLAGPAAEIEMIKDSGDRIIVLENQEQFSLHAPPGLMLDSLSTYTPVFPEDDDGDSGLFTLQDMIRTHAAALWDYQMYCAEQTAARVFALAVLLQMKLKDLVSREIVDFLYDKLNSYYDSDTGMFRIWDGLAAEPRTTSRVLRSLSAFHGSESPFAALARRSTEKLLERNHRDESLAFLDRRFLPEDKSEAFVSRWERLWRKGQSAELAMLQPGSAAYSELVSHFWSPSDFPAVNLVRASMNIPEQRIALGKKLESPGLLERLAHRLGLATPEQERNEFLRLPGAREVCQKNFADLYMSQGGTSLFGSTSSTVFLLQSLLLLARSKARLNFREQKRSLTSARPGRALRGVSWISPNSHFRRGAVETAGVRLRHASSSAVLCIQAPAHSRILAASEEGYFSPNGAYAEIPLQSRRELQVHLSPVLKGSSKLRMRLADMYRIGHEAATEMETQSL